MSKADIERLTSQLLEQELPHPDQGDWGRGDSSHTEYRDWARLAGHAFVDAARRFQVPEDGWLFITPFIDGCRERIADAELEDTGFNQFVLWAEAFLIIRGYRETTQEGLTEEELPTPDEGDWGREDSVPSGVGGTNAEQAYQAFLTQVNDRFAPVRGWSRAEDRDLRRMIRAYVQGLNLDNTPIFVTDPDGAGTIAISLQDQQAHLQVILYSDVVELLGLGYPDE